MDVLPKSESAHRAVCAFVKGHTSAGKLGFTADLTHRCTPGVCRFFRFSAGPLDAVYVCGTSLHTHRCGRYCNASDEVNGMRVCSITGNELGSAEKVHIGRGNRDTAQHGYVIHAACACGSAGLSPC
jgi:hypothetical protein